MTFEKHSKWVKDNINTIVLADLESLLSEYNSHNFETIDTEGNPRRIYSEMIDIVKSEISRRTGRT